MVIYRQRSGRAPLPIRSNWDAWLQEGGND